MQEEFLPRKVGLLPGILRVGLPGLQRGVQAGHETVQLEGQDVRLELGRQPLLVEADVDVTLQILQQTTQISPIIKILTMFLILDSL